ncbi:MAG: hypothetical protein ACP5C4_08690 [Methanomicrobiales archaeon]
MTDPGAPAHTRTTGPVPLFLLPHALSREIHASGRTIQTVAIVRTGGNRFRIEVTLRPGTPPGFGS